MRSLGIALGISNAINSRPNFVYLLACLLCLVGRANKWPGNYLLPLGRRSKGIEAGLGIIKFLLAMAAALVLLAVLFFVLSSADEILVVNSEEVSSLTVKKEFKEPEAVLLFVGDIMLSRLVNRKTRQAGDVRYPFLLVAEYLRSADLVFGNLEGPISTALSSGPDRKSVVAFRAEPDVVEGLKFAGFDVLSVANNHMWDYGWKGLSDTLKYLKSAEIDPAGSAYSYDEAHAGVIRDIGNIKVGFLAYSYFVPPGGDVAGASPAVSSLNEKNIVRDAEALKARVDIVVVSFHFGDEYQLKHNAFQEKLATVAIDAGAVIVVGHHPHVVQEVERYKNGIIAYSLGNFIFDQDFSEPTMQGLILKVIVGKDGIKEAESIKTKISPDYQVYIP